MLRGLVYTRARTRLDVVDQNLFCVFATDCPFWGVCDTFQCSNPRCNRTLRVMIIDAIMIHLLDQITQQLYELLDRAKPDDMIFRDPNTVEKERARRVLINLVFQTESEPRLLNIPSPGEMHAYWISEVLANAQTFLVAHEASHQGPQSIGPTSYEMHVPGAISIGHQYRVILNQDQALAWAKELGADISAFSVMATDAFQPRSHPALAENVYRSVTAGVALALKAWDLAIEERCYGNSNLYKNVVAAHPPARARVDYLVNYARVAKTLGIGDDVWAVRVLDVLGKLYL
jgi:hypothetical protein